MQENAEGAERQAGTSLPQSYKQRREVSSDCQHTWEWEDLGWQSHTFLFARERQGSTLFPAQFEQLSFAKVRRDYGVRREVFQRW